MVRLFTECYVLAIALLADLSLASRYHRNTSRIINGLLDEENYDRRLRPYFQEKPLNISVNITVENFEKLDEKELTFGITIYLKQFWHDDRLNHSLSYPVTLNGKYRELVWLPDTFVYNLKSATFHTVPSDNGAVKIFPDGSVASNQRLALDVTCDMALWDYPIDDQTCNITMLSYSYRSWEVDYNWGNKPHVMLQETSLAEFELLGFTTKKYYSNYLAGRFAQMTAIFTFKRRFGYSLLQIYAPTMLIVALSWLSFWVSKDAVPARITLGVTTILTIVTLVGSFRSQVPKVSYIKAIDVFFIVSFLFVFGAQMEYISVLLHSGVKDLRRKESQVPNKHNSLGSVKSTGNSGEDREVDGSFRGSDLNTVHIRKTSKSTKSTDGSKNIISMALKHPNTDIIDRIARILFPLGYSFFLLVYFLYFKLHTPSHDF